MSERLRPIKNNEYVLKPRSDKARGLIDPELEHQYKEVLRLREKLKMAISQKNRERLRS